MVMYYDDCSPPKVARKGVFHVVLMHEPNEDFQVQVARPDC